jgi:hypothetical protein
MPLLRPHSRKSSPSVLIMEDDFLVLQMLEEWTLALGYSLAGIATSIAHTRQELAKHNIDVQFGNTST